MWPTTASKTLTSPCCALGGEGAPAAPAPGPHVGALAFLERRQAERRTVGLRGGKRFGIEKHALRRHRLVGRSAEPVLLQRLAARRVMLGDLLEATVGGFFAAMIEAHRHVRQVVEQRCQLIVEQRQPMLLSRVAVTGADRLIQRIIARIAAEQLDVAATEQLLGVGAEGDLADRHQGELLHRLGGALRRHVEGFDRLQRVAEEVEPHGARAPGRIKVENAAAHGVLALLHDGSRARVAHEGEALRQARHVDALARRHRLDGALDEARRGDALHDRVDGRQHDGRVLARRQRQLGQRRHAACDDVGARADAVVRHRVPGGKRDDAHVGREERQRLLELLHAPVVAGDVQQRARRLVGRGLVDELRQHQRVETFRDAGDSAGSMIDLARSGAHWISKPSPAETGGNP